MGHDALAPEFPAIERTAPVPHSRWLDDRWTGLVELRWEVDPEHPVMIGAGWQRAKKDPHRRGRQVKPAGRLVEGDATTSTDVVAEIVRRRGKVSKLRFPVLPGSSLKGAIRQAYELLTHSCQQGLDDRRCPPEEGSEAGHLCPACSLFGAQGYGGRLSLSEATPIPGEKRGLPIEERQVPTAHNPQKPVAGTVRLYDLAKARESRAPRPLRKTPETVETTIGPFHSLLRLTNVSEDELGLLFLALGIGERSSSSGIVRVGGKKFHGLGAVRVMVTHARERYPRTRSWAGDDAMRWVRSQVQSTLKDPGRASAWKSYQAVIGRTP